MRIGSNTSDITPQALNVTELRNPSEWDQLFHGTDQSRLNGLFEYEGDDVVILARKVLFLLNIGTEDDDLKALTIASKLKAEHPLMYAIFCKVLYVLQMYDELDHYLAKDFLLTGSDSLHNEADCIFQEVRAMRLGERGFLDEAERVFFIVYHNFKRIGADIRADTVIAQHIDRTRQKAAATLGRQYQAFKPQNYLDVGSGNFQVAKVYRQYIIEGIMFQGEKIQSEDDLDPWATNLISAVKLIKEAKYYKAASLIDLRSRVHPDLLIYALLTAIVCSAKTAHRYDSVEIEAAFKSIGKPATAALELCTADLALGVVLASYHREYGEYYGDFAREVPVLVANTNKKDGFRINGQKIAVRPSVRSLVNHAHLNGEPYDLDKTDYRSSKSHFLRKALPVVESYGKGWVSQAEVYRGLTALGWSRQADALYVASGLNNY